MGARPLTDAEMVGKRFGLWFVFMRYATPAGQHGSFWLCLCGCGTMKPVSANSLRTGKSTGCGSCWKRSHGEAGGKPTKEYLTWACMKKRCNNVRYKHWGGRGIKVCARWQESFEAFLEDMGRAPSKAHSIERKDGDGDYTPDNCVWATSSEQNRNKRRAAH